MAMKMANSFAELEKLIRASVNNVLENEVAEAVKIEISNQVEETVYSAYPTPKIYERRGLGIGNQGLGDISQMNSTVVNGVLEVTDDADPKVFGNNGLDNNFSLAYNINEGYGSQEEDWNKPRDFIGATIEELERNKAHVKYMKQGLQDRGFDVV